MTENQIERKVEFKFNMLDARLMNSKITQEEYDSEAKKIHEWADVEYRFRTR